MMFKKHMVQRLVLSDGTKGMKGAIEKANELHEEIKDSFIPKQVLYQAF